MNTAAERNHAIYEDMWSRYELFPHDGWSSWSAIAPFYKPGRTLEIGPGKFPHVPIPGTHFVDLSRVALGALHEHGGLCARATTPTCCASPTGSPSPRSATNKAWRWRRTSATGPSPVIRSPQPER